jgi:hypothetical protein
VKNQLDPIERMLLELSDEYRAKDAEDARREQRARASVERERASAYLRGLAPGSKEALWFEDFARHFASREAAAVEVVRAGDELEQTLARGTPAR